MKIPGLSKFLVIVAFAIFSQSPYASGDHKCFTPHWGGLLAGESRERKVLKLYGDGFYIDHGYGRIRYYYDQPGKHTLAVYFGTDNFITDIFLHEGIETPTSLKSDDIEAYKVDWFNPREGFGKWHRLKIGASRYEAKEWMGEPREIEPNNEWIYFSDYSEVLPEGISLHFNNNRFITVRFWASQG